MSFPTETKTYGELDAVGVLSNAAIIPLEQSGVTLRTTTAGILALLSISNVGGGSEVAKSFATEIFEFRTLVAGSNVTVVEGLDTITISAAATASPLTTKGDIFAFDTADNRFPIGTAPNDFVLTVDSTADFGFAWKAASGGGATALNDLTDVTIASQQTGQVLIATSSVLFQNAFITDSSIAASAGIAATKISNGDVSNTEFDFLNGVTSSIQTQINSKLGTALNDGLIFVGNVSNVAAGVGMSGDITIVANGTTTIGGSAVTTGKIADSNVTNAKLASGTFGNITGLGIQLIDLNMGDKNISAIDTLAAKRLEISDDTDVKIMMTHNPTTAATGTLSIIELQGKKDDNSLVVFTHMDTQALSTDNLDPAGALTFEVVRPNGAGGVLSDMLELNGLLNLVNVFDNAVLFSEITAIPDAISNKGFAYVKPDASTTSLYFKDDAGTEWQLNSPLVSDSSIGDLSDVDLTGNADTNILIFDGTSTNFESHPLSGDISITNLGVATLNTNVARVNVTNAWAAGVKQTFVPDATNAGFNMGIKVDPDPSTPVNGDMYYNSTNNVIRVVVNSVWTNIVPLALVADSLTFNNPGAGGDPSFASNDANQTLDLTGNLEISGTLDISGNVNGGQLGLSGASFGTPRRIFLQEDNSSPNPPGDGGVIFEDVLNGAPTLFFRDDALLQTNLLDPQGYFRVRTQADLEQIFGLVTLDVTSTSVVQVDASFTLAKPFLVATGVFFKILTVVPGVIVSYTGTGAMIQQTGANINGFIADSIAFTGDGTNQFIDVTANFTVFLERLNLTAFDTIGTITGNTSPIPTLVELVDVRFTNIVSDGLTLVTVPILNVTNSDVVLATGDVSLTALTIDTSATQVMNANIINFSASGFGTSDNLLELDSDSPAGSTYIIQDSTINAGSFYESGSLTQTDNKVTARNNPGQPDSASHAELAQLLTVVAEIGVADTPVPVENTVPGTDFFQDPATESFTVSVATGAITYNGLEPITVNISFAGFIAKGSAGNQTYITTLHVGGSPQTKTAITFTNISITPVPYAYTGGLFDLDPGDVIQLFVESVSTVDDADFTGMSVLVSKQ